MNTNVRTCWQENQLGSIQFCSLIRHCLSWVRVFPQKAGAQQESGECCWVDPSSILVSPIAWARCSSCFSSYTVHSPQLVKVDGHPPWAWFYWSSSNKGSFSSCLDWNGVSKKPQGTSLLPQYPTGNWKYWELLTFTDFRIPEMLYWLFPFNITLLYRLGHLTTFSWPQYIQDSSWHWAGPKGYLMYTDLYLSY